MSISDTQSSRSSGWLQAILFNGLLILIPLLAARIVISAMSVQGFGAVPEPEAIAETREAIDDMFRNLPPAGADRRSYWADLIDRELRARDMASARGFLLGAPQMLDPSVAKAVKAAAESETTGVEDARIARAATLFLPNDVRARYERAERPLSVGDAEETPPPAADTQPARVTPRTSRFSMLGEPADLAALSKRWLQDESVSDFVVQITGLGLISEDVVESPVDVTLAASILKAAERAGRLHPSYERLLSQRLDAILPPETLRAELEAALDGFMSPDEAGERALAVFRETTNIEALPRLEEEFEQINRIADITSPSAATFLIEHARHSEDIRKARLVAEAGRERAAALSKELGPRVLGLAQSGLKWTRALVLQIMVLASLFAALVWVVFTVLARAFKRPAPLPAPLI